MATEREAVDALPANCDEDGLVHAFSDPQHAFRLLDKNGDGRITKEDLQQLLEQFGVKGVAAKVLSKYIFKELDANGNGTIEPSDLTSANGILKRLLNMKKSGSA